jgi:hypothetical protein
MRRSKGQSNRDSGLGHPSPAKCHCRRRRVATLDPDGGGHSRPSHVNLTRAIARITEPPNKRMQLTKLRAAPERQDKVPPCARAALTDAGTASQLIRSVGRTWKRGWTR